MKVRGVESLSVMGSKKAATCLVYIFKIKVKIEEEDDSIRHLISNSSAHLTQQKQGISFFYNANKKAP